MALSRVCKLANGKNHGSLKTLVSYIHIHASAPHVRPNCSGYVPGRTQVGGKRKGIRNVASKVLIDEETGSMRHCVLTSAVACTPDQVLNTVILVAKHLPPTQGSSVEPHYLYPSRIASVQNACCKQFSLAYTCDVYNMQCQQINLKHVPAGCAGREVSVDKYRVLIMQKS